MRKLLLVSVILVSLCAASAVLAKPEEPPKALLAKVTGKLVHEEKCNFHEEKNVECLIYFDEKSDTVWLMLFDDNLNIYKVVSVDNQKKEKVEWCRSNVCI